MIYKGYGLCSYEDYCQSIEFLCNDDSDCEPGTVCCSYEGMEQGICNYEDRCMSVKLLNDYVSEVEFIVEEPALLSPKSTGITVISIMIFLAAIIWLLWKNNQLKKKVKR